jgi:hypothetical protein
MKEEDWFSIPRSKLLLPPLLMLAGWDGDASYPTFSWPLSIN